MRQGGGLIRVSVVIPCFEAEDWIAPALRSVLHQTLLPHEILVVDDGSTDRSAALAERFGPPVRVIRQANAGPAAARIRGVDEATGDAVMFLDADDLIAPDTIASLAAVLDDHPDAVAICPWQRYDRAADGAWHAQPASCAPRRPDQDDLSAWLTGWYHPPCAVLWSRAAYDRAGGWDPAVSVNNDGDLMMRGFVRGNRLVLARTGTGFYRRLPGERTTVSGRRFSDEGLSTRIRVIDRIAAMLDGAGRLSEYARPLGQAYALIEADARGRDATRAAQAQAAARRHALPRAMPLRGDKAIAKHPGLAPSPRPAPGGWRDVRPDPTPAVSVVIPTFDRADLLPRAMASVLSQDFEDLELIVVDDASTDGTRSVVAAVGDPRIVYLRQDSNAGVSAARNRGLREARGRYVAFLDSDDEWLPGKLTRQVVLLQGAPDRVGLVYGGVEIQGPAGRRVRLPEVRGNVFAEMLAENRLFGTASNGLIRRTVFEMTGGFDESLPAIEDYDMWIRICRFYDVEVIDAPISRYYNAIQDDASRVSRRPMANLQARDVLHRRYRDDMRRQGAEQAYMLDTALRLLNAGRRRQSVRTLLAAIRRRPENWRLYGWLVLALMPKALRGRARRARWRLRRLRTVLQG